MKKNFFLTIVALLATSSALQTFSTPRYSSRRIQTINQTLLSLTDIQLRLKSILDSENEFINEERFLAYGILDSLLEIDKGYAEEYKQKAHALVKAIYQQRLDNTRPQFPRKMFVGEQGKINAGIVIRYAVEHAEGWPVDENLPDKKKQWNVWFQSMKLKHVLEQTYLESSPLKAFKIAYPEHFWNPDNWDKNFLWFDHNFSPHGIWTSSDSDHYVRQLIRYKIERVKGLEINENLFSSVKNWTALFKELGLNIVLGNKFNYQPLEVIRFAYPEKFDDGTLDVRDFPNLHPGRGPALSIHPPTLLYPQDNRYMKTIDGIRYAFGVQFRGYYASKLSSDFGGLFNPNGVLVHIFPLIQNNAVSYIHVPNNSLLWEIPENMAIYSIKNSQEKLALNDEQALQLFYDTFGINPFRLTLAEHITLVARFGLASNERLKSIQRHYESYGLPWLRLLCNASDYNLPFMVPSGASEHSQTLLDNYEKIFTLGQEAKTLLGESAPGYSKDPAAYPDDFLGTMMYLGYSIAGAVQKANNKIIRSWIQQEHSFITVKNAQEELSALLMSLKEYAAGQVEPIKKIKTSPVCQISSYNITRENRLHGHIQVISQIEAYANTGHQKMFNAGFRLSMDPIFPSGFLADSRLEMAITLLPGNFLSIGFKGEYISRISSSGTYLSYPVTTTKYFNPANGHLVYLVISNKETFADIIRAFRR